MPLRVLPESATGMISAFRNTDPASVWPPTAGRIADEEVVQRRPVPAGGRLRSRHRDAVATEAANRQIRDPVLHVAIVNPSPSAVPPPLISIQVRRCSCCRAASAWRRR